MGTPGFGVYEAPAAIGPLWIAWVEEGLSMVCFDGVAPSEEEQRRWLPADVWPIRESELPALVTDVFGRYFAGEPIDPTSLPVRIAGTKFQRRVWEALRRVPRGQVRTYAGLAQDARSPRAMRAVGTAMAKNPIPLAVPCHRVVGTGLVLGGFSGGLARKKYLLELEGVRVEGDRVRPGQLGFMLG